MSQQAVETARKSGMDVILGTFILGGLGETIKEVQNTISFAMKLDIDCRQFNILGAYFGTKLRDQMVTKGYIDQEKHWETGVIISDVYLGNIPIKKLGELIVDAYYRFALRKNFIVKEIFRFLASRFRFGMFLRNAKSGRKLKHFVEGEFS